LAFDGSSSSSSSSSGTLITANTDSVPGQPTAAKLAALLKSAGTSQRRAAAGVTMQALPSSITAEEFVNQECGPDGSGGLMCGVSNPIAAPTGTAQLLFYRHEAEHQLIVSLKDTAASSGTKCSAMAMFSGLKGAVPSTTGKAVTSSEPMVFSMRWVSGSSSHLVFKLPAGAIKLGFALTALTCPMDKLLVRGSGVNGYLERSLKKGSFITHVSSCSSCTPTKPPSTGTKMSSPTAGATVTIFHAHDGVGHLIEIKTSSHRLLSFRSHSSVVAPQLFHHVINTKTGTESVFRVLPSNGTDNMIRHFAGLQSRHPDMLLPGAAFTSMASAVAANSTRRGIAEKILDEVCDQFCSPCVKNALGSLQSCYSVVNPKGNCFLTGDSCAAAVAEDGLNPVADGVCVWKGYNCYKNVKSCYEALKGAYNTCGGGCKNCVANAGGSGCLSRCSSCTSSCTGCIKGGGGSACAGRCC